MYERTRSLHAHSPPRTSITEDWPRACAFTDLTQLTDARHRHSCTEYVHSHMHGTNRTWQPTPIQASPYPVGSRFVREDGRTRFNILSGAASGRSSPRQEEKKEQQSVTRAWVTQSFTPPTPYISNAPGERNPRQSPSWLC
jgi:hypothetical protein